MSFRLADRWIWDPWFARADDAWHLFFLQAPKSIGSADQRHWHVSIGHAVSDDLVSWERLPDALEPNANDPQAWDSYTTWTGSVVQHQGLWYLFYTGGSLAEDARVQRIGFATSEDLIHWHKYEDNPVLVGDRPPYEQLDLERWHEQAWRDPWLFRNTEDGNFHALITARIDQGPPDGRGVIGQARSPNLVDWEVLPPLTEAGVCGHMEVPQLFSSAGRHYLLFGIAQEIYSQAERAEPTGEMMTGVYYMQADHPLGSFNHDDRRLLLGNRDESYYAGKLLALTSGDLVYLPALYRAGERGFVGAVGDPLPVSLGPDGALTVQAPADRAVERG